MERVGLDWLVVLKLLTGATRTAPASASIGRVVTCLKP